MVETTTPRTTAKSGSYSSQTKQRVSDEYQHQKEDFQALVEDVSNSVSEYCRNRPTVAGIALFAFGFYVGWKVKPW